MVLNGCRKMLGSLKFGLAVLMASGVMFCGDAFAAEQAAAPAEPAAAAEPQMDQAAAAPSEPGDANIGRQLFTGEKRFANGGPACISCHNAGVGTLGGGALGPDLTMVYADPSKNPLLSTVWVNIPDIPVMGPIFSQKNITDEEMTHLRAFFAETSKQGKKASQAGTFTVIGIGGFVGILIVFNIIWSGRYRNRCKGTAHDALWRNYGGKGGR